MRFPAIFRSLIALMVLVSLGGSAQAALSARDLAVVRLNIVDLLVNETALPLPVRQRQDVLRAYYEANNGKLLWLQEARSDQLVARLSKAAADGLNPAIYPGGQLARLAATIDDTDKRGRAIIELHFSAAFLEYASDLKIGRVLPRKVDPNFFLQDQTVDQLGALLELASAASLGDFLDGWQPPSPQYAALRTALAQYRELDARGGWPTVSLGETLKPDMNDPRVPQIRTRLALTDGTSRALNGDDTFYDSGLVNVVKVFQARHGLEVDGIVGPATIVALNVPVSVRITGISVAMERWRWMPEDFGDHFLMVNIAGFDLRRVRNGAIEERMAVVVGKPYHRTPVFSDEIKYLEFNPYWNVPISIAVNEELPKLRKNPGARSAAGFEAVRGDQVYNLTDINWSQYGRGNFPYRLRQRPGTNNALGRVKFMFPNEHNVYLHDTPARSLFGRSARAFSHGCIRLERPLELADQVLKAGAVDGWNAARIDALIAGGKRTVVNLKKTVPVHITYLTAWVEGGIPSFRHDIYEHDEKLVAALDGKLIAW
jgi:murein L,D-transpeptidase YcbB/YkuD